MIFVTNSRLENVTVIYVKFFIVKI